MKKIGLSLNEIIEIQASEYQSALGAFNENVRSSIEQYISQGNSDEEAEFKAELTARISADVYAILTVIDANNQRLLSELNEIGLFNS